MPSIHFFNQNIQFKLPQSRKTKDWIKEVVARESMTLKGLNYIFCSDEHLLAVNQQYLKHDTLTDIITFDNSEGPGSAVEGDIFISIDRVRDNAQELKTDFDTELHRVMIHGLLHLIGYGDKTAGQKKLMREKEDTYLSLRTFKKA